MKKTFTRFLAALMLLAIFTPSFTAMGQTKAEEVYSTCLFGSDYNSQSVGSYTATWSTSNGDFTWTIVNGNNNNNAWSVVKFGRKNVESVGQITTAAAYSVAITKVELTIDAITAAKINSIKLYSGTSADNITTLEGEFSKETGTQVVNIATPATGKFYDIKFDCASGTANGLVTVSKVEYYYNNGGAIAPSITANDVEIAYDATSGVIEYTINNPVSGGVLTANTTATWINPGTVGTESVAFASEENEGAERTASVVLTYTYNTDQTVTKNVTVTQTANPNGPGSQANPYTVAQARAAIDAGTGTQGVYATGIVSAIPTAWSSQYNNITFNFVDEEGDNNFLQAFRCVSTNDADASTVAVGDIVVVYGNLKKYNSTYEFDAACQLVSIEHPAVEVEAPTFSPVAGTYAEAQTVTLDCTTENATIFYTIDGTDPATSNTTQQYENPITVSSTMTIKAVAVMGQYTSNMATANYYICSAEDPYTVTEALAFAEYQYPANGIYVEGIVSTAPTSLLNGGLLTYYISVDGEATNQLEVYKGKGLNNETFTAVDDIQVGDIVTIYGNVQVYNSTIEFASGNYLVSFERPTPVVEDYDLTVEPFENLELITFVDDEMVMEEDGTVQVTNGSQVMLSIVADEGYVIATLMVNGVDHAGDIADDYTYTFEMPAEDVTISATAVEYVPSTGGTITFGSAEGSTKINSTSVTGDDSMGNTWTITTVMNQTSFTQNASYSQVGSSSKPATSITFTTTLSESVTFTSFEAKFGGFNGTAGDITLMVGETTVGTGSLDATNDVIVSNTTEASGTTLTVTVTNIAKGVKCYYISYTYETAPTPQTFTLDIDQYTSGQNNGWYLIASPVSVDIESNTMISGTYDLYRFNPTATGAEWENYKNTEHSDFTTLVVGRGYLYANGNNGGIELSFTGTPADNGEVTTAYNGWNLIGNPLSTAAIVDKDYYRMNDTRTGIMTTSSSDNVAKMEGIFVQAEEGETVTFTAASKGERSNSTESVVLNLMQDGKVIDRAIVRFNSDRQMIKFQLFQGDTKIYFPMEDADYAIVSSNGQGNMPVNFKAARTGKYTLSVETEGIDMSYMHIIDRFTGEDVNVLLDNEYSFIASQSDVADRFILSFNENGYNADANETFAFQNGSDVIVNGNGELQVFDVTGRMVMNTTVNGVQSVNMPNGVYVFRMIGETVNTQKIVVR